MSARKLGVTLSLKDFVRQRQVVTLYRHFLKSVKKNVTGNVPLQEDLRQQVRTDFRRNKVIKDHSAISSLIQEANRNLERIKDLNSGSANDHGGTDSWINTEDEDDKRGRVGSGWPWGGGGGG
jgi:hypothetical protein